jgi:hypothetical protein
VAHSAAWVMFWIWRHMLATVSLETDTENCKLDWRRPMYPMMSRPAQAFALDPIPAALSRLFP